jgi:ATP phosphoribosyltransferase
VPYVTAIQNKSVPCLKRAGVHFRDMISGKQEALVDTPIKGNDEIRAKLVEAQEMLEAMQSGKLHIGLPFEGRTEAKIYDLRRQIAEYQSILDKCDA